jgi:hypothetical protein
MQNPQPPVWFQWVPLILIVSVGIFFYRRNLEYKRKNFMLAPERREVSKTIQMPFGLKIYAWVMSTVQPLALLSLVVTKSARMLFFESPSFFLFLLGLHITLFLSGIAILKSFLWARKLVLTIFSVRLLVLLIDLAIYDQSGKLWERPLFHFDPSLTNNKAIAFRVIVVTFKILFAVAMLFYFSRKQVRAALEVAEVAA